MLPPRIGKRGMTMLVAQQKKRRVPPDQHVHNGVLTFPIPQRIMEGRSSTIIRDTNGDARFLQEEGEDGGESTSAGHVEQRFSVPVAAG
mmetsp:Transcript_15088/g.22079  ORF Transcript_15088/g.22079 Transcript_15088/m.22079 type:complete len:89 (+) Transcript_15088:150-416(+)